MRFATRRRQLTQSRRVRGVHSRAGGRSAGMSLLCSIAAGAGRELPIAHDRIDEIEAEVAIEGAEAEQGRGIATRLLRRRLSVRKSVAGVNSAGSGRCRRVPRARRAARW